MYHGNGQPLLHNTISHMNIYDVEEIDDWDEIDDTIYPS